jgi:hypothetical protein
MSKKGRAYLIDFGLGGHSVEYAETWSDGTRVKGHISGYDSPESFERALARGEKNSYPDLSGLPVLDKREILKEHPEYSLKGPLLDVDLSDGTIDRIDLKVARYMLPGLSGGFDAIAAAAIVHEGREEPGPLDSVSLGDYLRWWTSRGARLGHMDTEGLRIVWEDEKGVVQ